MNERTSDSVWCLNWGNSLTWLARCRSFVVLLVFFSFADGQPRMIGIGPESRYYPVHDFNDDFLVYDEAEKAYVPYIVEQHADKTALSAYIDLESNRHYQLLIRTRQDGYLFVNAALKQKLRGGTWQVLSIDSLFRVYRQPEIFLTLYGAPGLNDRQLFIGYPKSTTQKTVMLRDDSLSLHPRQMSAYTSFLGIGLLVLLATHAFLFSVHHRAFLRFYSLRDLLSLRAQEESFLIGRPLSSINILFTINLSLVLAYLMLLVQSHDIAVFTSRSVLGEQTFGSLARSFLLLGTGTFIARMGKYVLLEVLGGLYKMQDSINVHFFKLLQSSMLFFTAMTLLVAVIAYNTPTLVWTQSLLLTPIIAFYTARLALLYLVIRSIEPIKNLYLFSYLCIVELIPLIIGLRFAL
ncbi:MAG: hypothetical protein JWP57_1352 [Spirosoma sp.]|nr:hypothetical protein [Spirosoma sp.]